MLEKFVDVDHKLRRFRESPAGKYLDGFAVELDRIGYGRRTGATRLRIAVHLGRWAELEGIRLEAVDEAAIAAFVAHIPDRCRCPRQRHGRVPRSGAGARRFLSYLRSIGVAETAPPVEQPTLGSKEADAYCAWLRQNRGLVERTLRAYRRVVVALVNRLGDDASRYTAESLRTAVRERIGGTGTSNAQQTVQVTRQYLRYLAVLGRCSPHLADALPTVAAWKLTRLPRHLSAADVERLIESCDVTKLAGLRDRAILLLLARLGLRASDIMDLRLQDIDWSEASFRVRGKSRHESLLPLPQDVGDAVLAYVEHGRPCVDFDHVFITLAAPRHPITNNSSVAGIVDRALARAGVSAPSRGAHLLRYSAATTMLRSGATLSDIGRVLRHRSIETTAHYARVDADLLRQVAQPWPEAATC